MLCLKSDLVLCTVKAGHPFWSKQSPNASLQHETQRGESQGLYSTCVLKVDAFNLQIWANQKSVTLSQLVPCGTAEVLAASLLL